MQVHYLEIVTSDVDATCDALEKLHGVSFGAPEAGLGNARTTRLGNGGRMGVRAPMHESETPVVRPYVLVEDIESAVEAAKAAGGEIAHPPMEIPGHGMFAIYVQGGIQHGLWQV
ncbi:MAG: hydroxylase [Acidobacteriota bacterium]|nr:hydroxylase [Acidobacteriota bacterium]